MIAIWPIVSWQLWARLDPARALVWTILAGYLLLPPLTVYNLPVVPDLDKVSVPNLAALFFALYLRRDRISVLPTSALGKALIGLFVISPFATVLANTDPLEFLLNNVRGMQIYDSVAAVTNQFIMLLPFFLARRYLGSPEGMRVVMVALILAGLAYSLPMLVEARLSPQMNVWVYGFFQHDFFQTIRFGGYRPMVFLQHGLWLAFFTLMCLFSGMVLFRNTEPEARPRALVVMLYLAFMLVVCKSVGPAVYALAISPLLLLFNVRWQMLAAGAIAVLVVGYPLLRGLHLVPIDAILEFAISLSPERGESLGYRFENEELLLARAELRPWFGWGGYGRNFIHDPVTGEMANIADGMWIITLGTSGWTGYIAQFGLPALPLLLLAREAWVAPAKVLSPYVAGLGLILAANLLDLLPNATLIPFTWLMAGALLGEAERLALLRRDREMEAARQGMHAGRPRRTVI
ncbi:MAG: hypothetical protein A3D16_15395 [Rhodobacterales bacterium RIFCSPHIGHO2_02_FULL_62_130]|nr:MAG: hypothetical protein A3E48_06315 [Rhodobacterales bacterium RIFCSPHIGHO2_12_FULL_62_75]OHC59817.1 MAG: hypothetical protein A3D16_15395 [Rhodobacterales bacterium RIFCSPHIGHO2_02_FULL_62_130]